MTSWRLCRCLRDLRSASVFVLACDELERLKEWNATHEDVRHQDRPRVGTLGTYAKRLQRVF